MEPDMKSWSDVSLLPGHWLDLLAAQAAVF